MAEATKSTGEKKVILLERENYEPAREFAIRCLEYNIVNLILEPGQMVSEKKISDELGISMTPVREAFFSLSQIGIIEIYPQRGSAVALIDTALVEESRFMRWAVERAVAEKVSKSHTDEDIARLKANIILQHTAAQPHDIRRMLLIDNLFHEILFHAAHKDETYKYISRYRVHFDRVRMLDLMATDTARNLNEHEMLLESIIDGNTEKTIEIVDMHLNHVTYDIDSLKEKYKSWFK